MASRSAVGDADFEFEFHEDAAKGPVGANEVDQLRRLDEPQPEFGFVALHLAGGSIDHRGGSALPGGAVGARSWCRGREKMPPDR